MGECNPEVNRMRIAWFTPFYYKSAIGKYSKYAAEELSKYAEIEIFTHHYENLHPTFITVNSFDSIEVIEKLNEFDICIYNMGDYEEYHALIYEVLKKKAGIVICHDVCMHNFMRGYYLNLKQTPERYISMLKEEYGEDQAAQILEAGNDSDKWAELNLVKYSLSEHLCDNALGVVVHSEYHRRCLSRNFFGKIKVVSLLNMNCDKKNDNKFDFKGYDKSKLNILTVGNVNPNKKIDCMIKAIGSHKSLRNKVNYTVIGSLANETYVKQLKSLISEFKLEDNVKLLGFVEDDSLEQYYLNADMISNLRYPAYEGGSASLVEQLIYGKATIVENTGLYEDLPDNTAFKVDVGREEEQIAQHLKAVLARRELISETGKNAQKFAEKEYSRDNYGKELILFVENILFLMPMYHLVEDCKKEFQIMGGAILQSNYMDSFCGKIVELFEKNGETDV